jgi:hypothetical protein
MKTLALGVFFAALLVLAPPADATRYEGSYSDAYARTQAPVHVKGKLKSGHLKGRVRCKSGCPIRGKLLVDCTAAGSNYFTCQGTVAGSCTVEGYYYGDGFQGQYECGPTTVGALSFGKVHRTGGGGGHGDGEGGSYHPPKR